MLNMNDESTMQHRSIGRLFRTFLPVLGFLIVLQLIRASLDWICYQFLPSELQLKRELSFLITFGGLTLIWLLVIRPKAAQLGLTIRDMSRSAKIWHIGMAGLLIVLFGFSAVIDLHMLAENLSTALVIPIAEELIFRGWLWHKVETALTGRRQQLFTWLITTALFAIWHLGYIDAVARNIPPQDPAKSSLAFIMFTKVLIGGAVGALSGLARWKTRHLYAAVFIHAIWNIFGR
jgi:membrane protease YdiL (CAAX protease family)